MLANTVSTCCCLQVILWIEIAVKKYDCVRASEIQALTSSFRAEQEHKSVGETVEIVDGEKAFFSSN